MSIFSMSGGSASASAALTTTCTTTSSSSILSMTSTWTSTNRPLPTSTTQSTATTCTTDVSLGKQQVMGRKKVTGVGDAVHGHAAITMPTSMSSESKTTDFTAQLLQFVGLPTNLAGHLVPQKFEQKRRVRQNSPSPNSNSSRPKKSWTQSQTKNSVNSPCSRPNVIIKPVIPKPGAPLPVNVILEGLSGVSTTDQKCEKNLANSTHKATHLTPVPSMMTSADNANLKPMSLGVTKAPEPEESKKDSHFIINTCNGHASTCSNLINSPQTDKDGFVIPNVNNIPDHKLLSHANVSNIMKALHVSSVAKKGRNVISQPQTTCIIDTTVVSSQCVNNTSPLPATDEVKSVIPTSNSTSDQNATTSSDELDTSCEELFIDESAPVDINETYTDSLNITEKPQAEDSCPVEENYHRKSLEDINEIGMELDELFENLTTDGTLLMDRQMRKKLKKLLKKQKRREQRASITDDSSDMYPAVKHTRHCAMDEEDIRDLEETEENSVKENLKFKSLKHKHVVRKYRQRELEEEELRKKKLATEPLSEGELSEEENVEDIIKRCRSKELMDKTEKRKKTPKHVTGPHLYSGSDWIEVMPKSPNDLQVTFTSLLMTGTSVTRTEILKKTMAERSGEFRGKEVKDIVIDEVIISKDRNKLSKNTDHAACNPQEEPKSPDVIEILEIESFLENVDNTIDEEEGLVSEVDEGLISVSDESDHEKCRKSSKSRQKYKKHSPRKNSRYYRDKRHRDRFHKERPSQIKSLQPRTKRSKSRSASPLSQYKRRDGQSRSQSPLQQHVSQKKHKRSRSRSPFRGHKDKHRRYRRPQSRSESHTRSPHRSSKEKEQCDKKHHSQNLLCSQNPLEEQHLKHRSHRRSLTPPLENNNGHLLVHDKPEMLDCNTEEFSMEISSGEDIPPLTIHEHDNAALAGSQDTDADVSLQLEEAMERLKKMEKDVTHRQMVIEDLESKASHDDESESPKPHEESADSLDEMDNQLLDAVYRLQKMEKRYSRRQMLLDNLRKSMLDAEKDMDAEVIEETTSSNEITEAHDDKAKNIPLAPSTSKTTTLQPPTSTRQSESSKPCTSLQSVTGASKKSRWDDPPKNGPFTPPPIKPPTVKLLPVPVTPTSTQNQVSLLGKRVPSTTLATTVVQDQPALGKTIPNIISRIPPVQHPPQRLPGAVLNQNRQPQPRSVSIGSRLNMPPSRLLMMGPQVNRPAGQMSLLGSRPNMLCRPRVQTPVGRHHLGNAPAQMPIPVTLPSRLRSPATVAPIQPNNSNQQVVWLVGSSVLCQAARYVAQGPVGLGLMLTQAELVWHGHDSLKWSEFGVLLTRLIRSSKPPDVLLVHMDALELATSSFQILAQQAVESLLEYDRRNPKCRIIWSETLPCCQYPGTIAQMTMEQVRINYNVMCSKLVLSLGGQVIKHSDIRPEKPMLFNNDKMHLSDLGNSVFLNNLRRGLAFLLCEPKTKIYCASNDRTF